MAVTVRVTINRTNLEDLTEVVLAHAEQFDVFQGHDRGVARYVEQQGGFAEEIALAELGHGLGAALRGAHHIDASGPDQVKLFARIALPEYDSPGGVFLPFHSVGRVGQCARGQLGEGGDVFEELADLSRHLDHHVGLDSAVDHGHDSVGHIENAVVVGDHEDRGALLAHVLLEQRDDLAPGLLVE